MNTLVRVYLYVKESVMTKKDWLNICFSLLNNKTNTLFAEQRDIDK